jgi:uncharacterized membrane protein YhaH (DUF805 family)
LGAFFVLVAVVTAADAVFPGVGEDISNVSTAILIITFIPFSWINLAVQIRRCHDLDKSGWMVLINVIPYLGAITLLVVFGFFPGTSGENRYGIEPD